MTYNPHRRAALLMADEWLDTWYGQERIARAHKLSRNADPVKAEITDVFGQPYKGWDVGQLFALYCLDHMFRHGFLHMTSLYAGGPPLRDRKRKENEAMLRSVLPPNVTAYIDHDQTGRDMDGRLRWSETMETVRVERGNVARNKVDPGWAPLEIGYADATTTCLHLAKHGAVARWPNSHNIVRLLVVQPRHLFPYIRVRETKAHDSVIEAVATYSMLTFMGYNGNWLGGDKRG